MANLASTFAGIRSPNPFWLASAPPTDKEYNVRRAFQAGWGGVVWKTLGLDPHIVNVNGPRYGAVWGADRRLLGLNNIELIRKHLNPDLAVSTILMTMYDARTRLSAQVAAEVREHFPNQVLKTRIPRSVRISEAPSFGQTVITYDPSSSGALSYLEAATELAAASS